MSTMRMPTCSLYLLCQQQTSYITFQPVEWRNTCSVDDAILCVSSFIKSMRFLSGQVSRMDPASVIETDRLRLVDVDPDVHAAAINALVVESFDSLHPYMLFAEKLPSVEDTREAFRMMRESRKDGHFCNFAIFSKVREALVWVLKLFNRA